GALVERWPRGDKYLNGPWVSGPALAGTIGRAAGVPWTGGAALANVTGTSAAASPTVTIHLQVRIGLPLDGPVDCVTPRASLRLRSAATFPASTIATLSKPCRRTRDRCHARARRALPRRRTCGVWVRAYRAAGLRVPVPQRRGRGRCAE